MHKHPINNMKVSLQCKVINCRVEIWNRYKAFKINRKRIKLVKHYNKSNRRFKYLIDKFHKAGGDLIHPENMAGERKNLNFVKSSEMRKL